MDRYRFPVGKDLTRQTLEAYIKSNQEHSSTIIRDFCTKYNYSTDTIPLLAAFRQYHEDYYEPGKWLLLVSRAEGSNSSFHTTTYILDELVLARTFYALKLSSIEKVLGCKEDVTVAYTTGDFPVRGPKSADPLQSVVFSIHGSVKYGRCLSYMRSDQADNKSSTLYLQKNHLQDCSWCDSLCRSTMDHSTTTVLDHLRNIVAVERNYRTVQNCLPTGEPGADDLDLLKVCMSLGFSSHLTEAFLKLHQGDPNIYTDICILEKSNYAKYFDALAEKGKALERGSDDEAKARNTKYRQECKTG